MVHLLNGVEMLLAIISLIFIIATQCSGIGIIVLFKKANKDLVKAKLFLGDTLLWMWIYATASGIFFVINGFLFYLKELFDKDFGILNNIVQTLFAFSFFLLAYSWFSLFKKGVPKTTTEEK